MPLVKFKYSETQITKLLEGIHSGEITEYDIPNDLYYATADYLLHGLYTGFGGTLDDFEGKDWELLNNLRENVYMFSAAKNFQELKDIQGLMFDDKGERISMNEFSKLGAQRFETWNDAWGRTEYGTAVGQAQMASKWEEVERNADLLPIAVFDTKGNPCPECAPFNNFAAPVSDPIWGWLTPLLHFNCECVIRTEEKGYPLSDRKVAEDLKDTVPKMFQMNPAKDGYIFSDEHPYFQVEKKDREFAKENFGKEIPEVKK